MTRSADRERPIRRYCAPVTAAETARFVIGPRCSDGSYLLRREPDGPTLSARGWDDVWSACPEFGVPWRNVTYSEGVREQVLADWGTHPDAP
jgi:hypothetical protein